MKPNIKYIAIFSNKDKYTISFMCNFFEVSRSGYYSWLKIKDQTDKDDIIAKLISECQTKTKNTYGYRRVKSWLFREKGITMNHKSILRIMRKYGLLSEIRRTRILWKKQRQFRVYHNKINRDFKAEKPNQKWVTDISYIKTKEGMLYLSMIKDLYDNFIVAFDMATIQDNALVFRTINKAKNSIEKNTILHSDQGYQYTSHDYMKLTKKLSILPSMSRAGNPLDNSPAENFFGILKTECIYRHKINTQKEAEKLIHDYIYFYNYERIQLKTQSTPYETRIGLHKNVF